MSEERDKLKPCGCGKIPSELYVSGSDCKWAWVSGDCCGEWSIDFRTNYYKYDSKECMELARAAWQEATRLTTPVDDAWVKGIIKSIPNEIRAILTTQENTILNESIAKTLKERSNA